MTRTAMARDLLHHLVPALAEDYRVERELGAGATAKVYLAHDLKHDRTVALKVLRPELALAVGAERFLREIQTAARLSHPGILPLYDSGEADGLLYFTMPFVEGESLRHLLDREKRLPVPDAVRITREVADALAHAHARGVIHRDIKPENILLANGRPLVADFGIALALEESESERLTHTGMVVGTPPYMSPEQSAGLPLDGRSDVYSLACVLYELLTGRTPFVGPTVQAIAAKRRTEAAPRVRTLRDDVPAGVDGTLAEALATDPAERFSTTEAFAAALADPARRQRRWMRRRARLARRWAAIGVGLAAVGVAGGTWMRSAPRAPLRARDWILVADFEGPRSDRTLATSVRELVTTELNQSRFVSTVARQQLAGTLRSAGLPDTTTVNIDLARELAFRSAVRAVVGGRVSESPGGYMLALHVVDTDGQEIASAAGAASTDSLIPAVQRLSQELRAQLGERRSDLEANQFLLDIATPSLPAYRKYVEALARKQTGDVAGSTRVLRAAVALDTGFAAAWALMGLNYIDARDIDSARVALSEALRRPARLSTTQRFRLMGDAAYAVDHDLPAAVRWYGQYLARMPRSVGGHNNRGLFLSMLGRYDAALADFDSATSNNPLGPDQGQPVLGNATDMLVALGRLDRATAKARELTGAFARYADLRFATIGARWAAAESVASITPAMSGAPPALLLEATTTRAAALAARGAVAAADTVLADAADRAAGPSRHWFEQARSLLAMTSGTTPPPLARRLTADDSPGALVARGVRLALLGDTVGAHAASRRIAALGKAERDRLGQGPHVIVALVAAAGGRWREVVDTLGESARNGEHDATSLDRPSSLLMRWIVADAYARLDRPDSAIATMNGALSYERVPPGHLALIGFAYPYGRRRLAMWHTQRGERDAARREWEMFSASFVSPDLPLRRLRNEVLTDSAPPPNGKPDRARARSTPHAG